MAKRPRGRPTVYEADTAEAILLRLASGESLRAICSADDLPAESTVRQWVIDDREGFAARYARAREMQVEHWADEILEIADDGGGDEWTDSQGNVRVNSDVIQRSRLRVDTRKWLMSKLVPNRYGEKQQIEQTQTDFVYDPERFTVEGNRRVAAGEPPHVVAASGGLKET